MDWQIFHAVDEFSSDYKWLAHSKTVGVVVSGLAVLVLWLATPPGEERRWKVASLAGVVSAALSLGSYLPEPRSRITASTQAAPAAA